ncbi:MAG: hypothetical protein H6661_10225 [Ardenticatenaceae bacterium]|nr:hypothetical protein [Ardenticatenaceae bacterium]
MSNAELRVTLALVRETYGYHRESCTMTYADFQAYGLSSPDSIRRGIAEVLDRKFFVRGDGRSEFAINTNTMEAVENEPENTTVNVETTAAVDNETTVNVENDAQENYGKRSVSFYKEKAPNGAKKKKARASRPNPPDHPVWELPEPLKTADFEAAWIDFFKHRLENGRYLTQTSGNVILAWLADIGPERAVTAVRHSIAKGWINIYEPDGAARASPNGRQPAQNTDLVPLGDGLF